MRIKVSIIEFRNKGVIVPATIKAYIVTIRKITTARIPFMKDPEVTSSLGEVYRFWRNTGYIVWFCYSLHKDISICYSVCGGRRCFTTKKFYILQAQSRITITNCTERDINNRNPGFFCEIIQLSQFYTDISRTQEVSHYQMSRNNTFIFCNIIQIFQRKDTFIVCECQVHTCNVITISYGNAYISSITRIYSIRTDRNLSCICCTCYEHRIECRKNDRYRQYYSDIINYPVLFTVFH